MNLSQYPDKSPSNSAETDETPSSTGSKMGAEPQALPDDPVSPGSHTISSSKGPVQKGLSASEMIEAQQPGGEENEVKGDKQPHGSVGTIIDQERKAPDLSRHS